MEKLSSLCHTHGEIELIQEKLVKEKLVECTGLKARETVQLETTVYPEI